MAYDFVPGKVTCQRVQRVGLLVLVLAITTGPVLSAAEHPFRALAKETAHLWEVYLTGTATEARGAVKTMIDRIEEDRTMTGSDRAFMLFRSYLGLYLIEYAEGAHEKAYLAFVHGRCLQLRAYRRKQPPKELAKMARDLTEAEFRRLALEWDAAVSDGEGAAFARRAGLYE
jgi:hypothetical protein